MNSNASGQEIVEELDALSMLSNSPNAADGDFREHNLMSPHSTDWSRALGWAGGSPFQTHAVPLRRAAKLAGEAAPVCAYSTWFWHCVVDFAGALLPGLRLLNTIIGPSISCRVFDACSLLEA